MGDSVGMGGIIQLDNGERHLVKVTDVTYYRGGSFESLPEIKCRVLPVFAESNRLEMARRATIKRVIFNEPATIVIWSDDSKTVVKCQPGDTYSKETGLALCIAKKFLGNKGNFNDVFKKYIKE